MNKLVTTVLMAATFLACGGSKGESSGPGQDWSSKPLDVTVTDKVHGVGFTIKSPKGMKLEHDDGPDAVTKSWEADLKDNFSEPGFSVSFKAIPATTLDEYVKYAALDDKDVVAKKEATADGFLLVTHTKNKGIVRVEQMKKKGDVNLECRISQAKTGGVPNADKTIAWMQEICASLTIL
jgi:hypothetical protein